MAGPGYEKSVMVALLPTTRDWTHLALPHLTLVYVGEIDAVRPTLYNELAKDAMTAADSFGNLDIPVVGVDEFGGGDQPTVDALRLVPTTQLLALRRIFDRYNGSQWTEFDPHVTVGPVGSATVVPDTILFDRISVCWGKEMVSYLFRQPDR